MGVKWNQFVVLVGLAGLPLWASAEVLARFYCKGDNEGAVLFIDGKQKGSCPSDLYLPAGRYVVTAIKAVDADHERRFEQTIQLQDDEPARVKVELAAPQLTKAAVQRRAEAARAEEASRRRQALQEDITKAEADDPAGLQAMIRRFTEGDGVKRDLAKVPALQQRLMMAQQAAAMQLLQQAEAGNATAMRQLAQRYREGSGVEKSEVQAAAWDARAELAGIQAKAAAEADAKLTQFTFVPAVEGVFDFPFSHELARDMDNQNILGVTTFGPSWGASVTVAAATDLISLPFNITSYQQLKKKGTSHAAAWHEPDSLMARVYAQQQ